MTNVKDWRGAVTVVRAASLEETRRGVGRGRATAFDFTGSGGGKTWLGTATLAPQRKTGTHHHGRHEVAIYVIKGHSEIRWGEELEFAAMVSPGDCVYFAPFVPHQESNPDVSEPVELLVVRSDNERIAVMIDTPPVDRPEKVF